MKGNNLWLGLVAALLLLPALPSALAATPAASTASITIGTNSKWYKPGEAVTINGTTTAGAGVSVNISVNNTQATVFQTTVQTIADGKYVATFTLASDAYIGVYRAGANDGTHEDKTSFTVSNITPADLVANMIKLAQDGQARAEKLFQQLKDEGATVSPEAQKDHDEGVTELTNTQNQLSSGHPVLALAAARNAMNHFRDAIWDANKFQKVITTLTNNTDALNATIKRDTTVVNKLNTTITQLKKDGKDVTNATSDISDAKTKLTAAASELKTDQADAVKLVLDAQVDVDKAIEDLKPLAVTMAHDGLMRFLNSAEARADNLEAQLRKMRTLGDRVRVDAAIARLELAKGKISSAIAALKNGRDLESLKGMTSANYDIKTGIGNIGSAKDSANLSNVNMLQAKIQFLQRMLEQMQKWNMDTTSIKAQIAGLQAQLDKAQQITTTP